jgi:transcriptional regulator with XRE-family HTH domain
MTKRHTIMRLARERLGISQAAMARQLGVSQPTVSSWEQGTRPVPNARRTAIAELLKVSEDQLTAEVSF